MSPTKTSAPTNGSAEPITPASGRNGTESAISAAKPNATPRAPSTNGKQSTKPPTIPTDGSSAASPFILRRALRLYIAECDDKTPDEIVDGFLATLDQQQRNEGLRQAIRGNLSSYLGIAAGHVRRTIHRTANGSAKWDGVRTSHEDGSLDEHRRILDMHLTDSSGKVRRFGLFGVGDIEWMVATRKGQARSLLFEVKRYQDVAAEMERLSVTCVDELPSEWLVERWRR